MAYTRTQWEESVTPLSAQNMNNIEDGVEEALSLSEGNSDMWAYIRNLVYPVGSIYMSVNNTNPSTLFGGTWVAWGEGKVPVGVNTSDTDFNAVEKTGGAKTHSHTNPSTNATALTVNQIPSHTHSVQYLASERGAGQYPSNLVNTGAGGQTLTTSASGGSQGHTHGMGDTGASSSLQPYITCYMWKRTA